MLVYSELCWCFCQVWNIGVVMEELVGTAEVKLSNPRTFEAVTNWYPIDTGGNLYCTFRRLLPTVTGGRPSQASFSPRRSTYKKVAGASSADAEATLPEASSPALAPPDSMHRRYSLSDVRAGWPVRVVVHATRSLTLSGVNSDSGEQAVSLFVTAAAVDESEPTVLETNQPEAACTESIVVRVPKDDQVYEWEHENGNELLVDMRTNAQIEGGQGQTHVKLEVWGNAEPIEETSSSDAKDFLVAMVSSNRYAGSVFESI